MTLDELQAKLPAQFKPWATAYGPVFLAMGADEIKAWIERILKGDIEGAYRQVLTPQSNPELLAEWDGLNAEWMEANVANAAKIAAQKEALTAIVKILLAIALAAAGF